MPESFNKRAGSFASIYFANTVPIAEPTGAVFQYSGINGLIMEMEEIPVSGPVHFYKTYKVAEIKNELIQPSVFNVPEGYREFKNINDVRGKTPQLLNEKSSMQTGYEKNIFMGTWIYKYGNHILHIHIENAGKEREFPNDFSFCLLSLKEKIFNPVDINFKVASVKAGFLCVENPPNFSLYEFNQKDNTIELTDKREFKYQKVNEEELRRIQKDHKIDFL